MTAQMKLHNPTAGIYIPDGKPQAEALARVTHLGIGAHQDDLEFMAFHGILECFAKDDKWFGGVTCTDGAGSSRTGPYAKFTDVEMMAIRRQEQDTAALIGGYGGAAMARVIILPCVTFALIFVLGSLGNWWMQVPFTPSPVLLAVLWFALGIGNNVAWLLYVRKRLPAKLHTFALRRYSPEQKSSWLKSLVRKIVSRSPAPPLIASLPGQTQP